MLCGGGQRGEALTSPVAFTFTPSSTSRLRLARSPSFAALRRASSACGRSHPPPSAHRRSQGGRGACAWRGERRGAQGQGHGVRPCWLARDGLGMRDGNAAGAEGEAKSVFEAGVWPQCIQRAQGRSPGGVVLIGVKSLQPAPQEAGEAGPLSPHRNTYGDYSWELRLELYFVAHRAGLGPEERSGGCLHSAQWPHF